MLSDLVLLFVERVSRHLYWSWPKLRRWRSSTKKHSISIRQQCGRDELLRYLGEIGVKDGALVMVHTGTDSVEILDESCPGPYNAIVQAQTLMQDLVGLTAPDGTLVMPTHAMYQTDELRVGTTTSEITTYDPRRSPCGVGLVNELFWRRKGVKRSLFPFNMLAACGLLADELLRDNLNERHPSPHGTDSGYYRFCQCNGLVVSIGVPLREYITIAHVVEEVREDWPIKDFFTERNYWVVEDEIAKEWTVRLRRDDYAKFAYCRSKMGRDMVAEGVIHEGHVGTVRVDWARAGEVFDFFWRKTKNSPYPYYALWMKRKPWRKRS
jgi:aminoglycoside N3'-acetyltransferase